MVGAQSALDVENNNYYRYLLIFCHQDCTWKSQDRIFENQNPYFNKVKTYPYFNKVKTFPNNCSGNNC